MVPEELAKELFLVSYSNKTVPIDRRTFNNLNETLQKRWIKVAIFVLEKFSTPQEKEGLDNSIKPCDHVFSPETTKFSYQSCIKQGCNAVIFSKPSLKLPEKNNLDEALKELECDSVELNQMIGWNKAIEEVKRLNQQ